MEYVVWHKTKRGGTIGEFFYSLSDVKDCILRLFKRRIEATAKNELGDTVGGVWKMDNRWHWFVETE